MDLGSEDDGDPGEQGEAEDGWGPVGFKKLTTHHGGIFEEPKRGPSNGCAFKRGLDLQGCAV